MSAAYDPRWYSRKTRGTKRPDPLLERDPFETLRQREIREAKTSMKAEQTRRRSIQDEVDVVEMPVTDVKLMFWRGFRLREVAEHFDVDIRSLRESLTQAGIHVPSNGEQLAVRRQHREKEKQRQVEERRRAAERRQHREAERREQQRLEQLDDQRRQDDQIVALYRFGLSVAEIAEGEGITPNKVRTTLRERKVVRDRASGVRQARVLRDVLQSALHLQRRALVLEPEGGLADY